jgi:hypothetical protein
MVIPALSLFADLDTCKETREWADQRAEGWYIFSLRVYLRAFLIAS